MNSLCAFENTVPPELPSSVARVKFEKVSLLSVGFFAPRTMWHFESENKIATIMIYTE